MKKLVFTLIAITILSNSTIAQEENKMDEKVIKTEKEWKEILTGQQYYVLRQKGTDAPSSDGYSKHFKKGTYHCAACDAQLFKSDSKYDSDCGWPHLMMPLKEP